MRVNPLRRRISIWLLATFLLTTVSLGEAQQQAKMAKIGWLGERGSGSGRETFARLLRELGHVEGKNLVFEYRYSEGKADRLPVLAGDLVRLKVDVIVTLSGAGTLAAKKATGTIPIVFVSGGDPVVAGLVDSFPHPGGNITGFTNISSVLAGKRLELLKETVPKLSRVAVVSDPQDPASAQIWKESQVPAREMGLQIYSIEVGSAEKFESSVREAIKAGSVALAVLTSPLFARNQNRITELAAKYRLPAIYGRGDFVENGGLMSYGPDRIEPYRRAAVMVDKILKGTKPADIPVEQPTKFEMVINLKTAKALGLTIPPIVLMRAQRVIK